MAKKTIHTFSIAKESLIWKILPDPEKNFILLESRNPQTQSCQYSILDLNNCSSQTIRFNPENSWWLNIVDFKYPYVSMEEFIDDKNPTIKGSNVYNIKNGNLTYRKDGAHYIRTSQNTLVLGTIDNKKLILVDYANFDEEEVNIGSPYAHKYLTPKEESSKYILPVQYVDEDDYFKITSGFISKTINVSPVRSIEYLEYMNFVCMSYYILEEDFLVNFLLVLNKKGEILLQDKLDSALQGIGSETFFIFNKQLVFVKNKIEIAVYPLIEN